MTELLQFTIIFIGIFSQLLYWVIFIYIILSWFIQRPNKLWNTLGMVVRPILKPFRWARIGMIDFSPIAALFIIDFVGMALVSFLSQYVSTV